MIVDVWSWNAKPGKAGEATAWGKKAAEIINSQNVRSCKVLRPRNGDMMKVYLVTEAETSVLLEECWATFWGSDEATALMKTHNDVFDQNTSKRFQYNEA